MNSAPAYGLWTLVILNALVFIAFAFSFYKQRTRRDWRSFSAFLVALFTEISKSVMGWLLRSLQPSLSAWSRIILASVHNPA